jgi:nucleoside-triphosphatase THEP1
MTAHIVILTGERSAGKTTVCRKTITLAQTRGYTCGGILTLSAVNDVRDVLDVHGGHVRRLTVEPNDLDADSRAVVVQGRFHFDPETMDWGNDVLAHVATCHLLVVDELGPLEIERGQGWQKAFDALRGNNYALALVVVRPELLKQAELKLPAKPTTILTVDTHNRDDLPNVLLEMLEEKSRLFQITHSLLQHP